MKALKINIPILLTTCLFVLAVNAFAQDSTKNTLNISLSYFNENNKVPYLVAKVKSKIDGKFRNIENIPLSIFLDADTPANLIAKVVSNENGTASAFIPPSLQAQWGHTAKHDFIVRFDGNKTYDLAKTDLSITPAKIIIDTTSDKKITATVLELQDTSWVPVKGVDVGIAVRRMDAFLNVNETATFSTDSTGQVSADFKRDNIPGDLKGNIELVAKVDDNDKYGNLIVEKAVPWGAKFTSLDNNFDKRTLFATRNKAPYWLLVIAYSIAISVWGTLLLLIVNLFKIRKLGLQADPANS
jgi:hypothetical protein